MNLNTVSRQWATRPDDQRYLSLEDLKQAVARRKSESWTSRATAHELRILPDDQGNVTVSLHDPSHGEQRTVTPTHWGFGQLAQYANAPASYLRRLPAELAAINLQWGLERDQLREETLILGQTNGSNLLRSMTSTSYGRIWDRQVVDAVERVNADGRWQVPAASYSATNPRRATTLYASDRDVFIFLVDPSCPVEVGGETLYRGFYTWNSEVGAATFGLTTFLYRTVCDNRIIWGATEVRELKIRHTGGAPERFAYEGARYLRRYTEESTYQATAAIQAAQRYELPPASEPEKPGSGWEKWLTSRGFTSAQARASVQTAQAEEGQARSLWDIVNGITAYARQIPHTDERVKVEQAAGKLLEIVK